MWRLIESSAKMNCPAEARLLLPAMVATRTGFAHLEQALVANLVQEKVRHVLAELGTQARYAIDILVRNLYERTADVGFLATDADLCRFVAGLDDDREQARQRLADYRDKYTVYDEILLLDTEGRVLVQADPATPVTYSRDPLLQPTLDQHGYRETFRATDLRPGKARALVYSHRMLHPDTGAPVGVLCLCFNFEQEMDAIFAAYRDPSQRANMLLLDAHDHVISSADPLWIPAGVRVPTNAGGQPQLLMFGGREYLVRTYSSAGYQGYPGPAGWKAQLMIPVDLAFRSHDGQALAGVEPALMHGLLSHAEAFSPSLHELMSSVTRTTRTIERIVWNGKITSAANDSPAGNGGGGVNKLNTVLDQITETGERSDALFSHSIQDLYQTVLASSLSEAGLTSQLLVDMLDRNLYERANDCRWWAQSAQLRRGLAQPSADQAAAMTEVLRHINRLYTVYARLFVYDRSGRILASTGDQQAVGQCIDGDTLGRVCALRSALDHYAEPFAPSPLYGGAATYTYHAAIRHPAQSASVIGGIGIVFDAQPELLNMLVSGVAGRENMRACFVTPDGRVLSSTDAACAPGDLLPLDPGLLQQACSNPHGASVARIVQHDGQYVIAACTRAGGYREFRAADGVEQPVLAVLLQAFGAVRHELPARASVHIDRIDRLHDSGSDFAIFYAGRTLMALRAAQIQEAVPFAKVQRTASAGAGAGTASAARIGMLDVPLAGGQQHVVWVFDLALLATGRPGVVSDNSQVMLVRHGGSIIGLLVDDLHSVQQFDGADMTESPLGGGDAALAPRLIKANQGNLLIQEIDLDRLFARLRA
ncbi:MULTISPECIES: chemotaxis protein CheW [unclassified Duganella]|uniref:chemotaxis protein CheW n=1 Tax=unclassified Duganella TaxID=2636909 RepID=UPI001E2B07AA|nr:MULTISPECIES: chemotaxis protein CheW [unclassified Duganella]